MCENCREFNEKKYPDLGDGGVLDFAGELETGMNADPELGIRIWQERRVTYMGPDGVISKPEADCVYLPWHTIISKILPGLMDLYQTGCPVSQQLHDLADIARRMEERDE